MLITANGKELDISPGTTIHGFLESRGIKPGTVVIEYNHNLPPKESWPEIILNEGDNLEVIKMMGGG